MFGATALISRDAKKWLSLICLVFIANTAGASVVGENWFTKLVYSHETRPDLVSSALRYANSREGLPLRLRLERAEHYLIAGNPEAALRNYKTVAWYGDKYAQYQIARIYAYGLGDQPPDPATGLAWLALAAEHPTVRAETRQEVDSLWQQMNEAQRNRARSTALELASEYSNLAVLDRVQQHLYWRMREQTGSRLTNSRGMMLSSTEGIYENLTIQQEFSQVKQLIDQIGSVEFGELIVLEPDSSR